MIDFRYHVISLASIFLALAVGVVLGSGPLRTALVSELTNQTEELTAALDASQAETQAVQDEAAVGEQFTSEATAALIGGALDGRHVAIIRMFEPDGDDVTSIRDRVSSAGGTVTANVSIEPAWTDDGQTAFRAAFAAQIVENVVGVDATVSPDRVLAHAFAQMLIPTEFPEGTTPEAGAASTATAADRAQVLLDLLKGADLVSGSVTGTVDTVIFVVGPGPTDPDELALLTDVYVQIVGVTDEYAGGTLVATGPPIDGDMVEAIQVSALLQDSITTVSDGLNFFGSYTVVLALAKEVAGSPGHYGFGDDLVMYPN